MKQYHTLVQGEKDWHQHRATHFNASDAPAMMGVSKYKTRDALLKQMATGEQEEISPALQKRFDDGHKSEALAKPLAEKIIGEELFNPTISLEVEGLKLSASLDGETMDESIIHEHKYLNKDLARDIPNGIIAPMHKIQMEQQLLLSGAKKCLFMASENGNKETMVYLWYESNPELRKQIIAGWHQFKKDLETYELLEVKPEVVAQKQDNLPAVFVQVNGEISVDNNLEVFSTALLKYVNGINHEPKSDQDFAELENSIKVLKQAEASLAAAEENALAQTASVSTMRTLVAENKKLARDNRLIAEKTVKAQKQVIKFAIADAAKLNFSQHLDALMSELMDYTFTVNCDFIGVMKGKSKIDALHNAVNTELAQRKIEANEIAGVMRANLNTYIEIATDYNFLFNDMSNFIQKQPDDFKLLVESRINQHKKAEQERLDREREQMRLEEERKAQEKIDAENERKRIEQENIVIAEQREEERKAANAVALELAQGTKKAVEEIQAEEEPIKSAPEAMKKETPRTIRKSIPTDNQIINVLAVHYEASPEIIIGWLQRINYQQLKAS